MIEKGLMRKERRRMKEERKARVGDWVWLQQKQKKMTDSDRRRLAVVLGGGGVCGIAWETGIVRGLQENGVDLTSADLFVGTSAGSVVGAQLATGCDTAALLETQRRPWDPSEQVVGASIWSMLKAMIWTWRPWGSTRARLARLGAVAVAASVPQTEAERLAVVRGRLPRQDWPEKRNLLVTAVDCADGSLTVWSRDSVGVSLVDAVASSCAIPCVAPTVAIGARRYMDGGMHSPTCATLAAGFELVVVIAVTAGSFQSHLPPLSSELAKLRAGGSNVVLIVPDAESRAAIFPNPTDSRRRQAAANAGFAQGFRDAAAVARALAEPPPPPQQRSRVLVAAAAVLLVACAVGFWAANKT